MSNKPFDSNHSFMFRHRHWWSRFKVFCESDRVSELSTSISFESNKFSSVHCTFYFWTYCLIPIGAILL